jgi:hypothetical protein
MNNFIKNAIYIIGIISISLSMYFAINLQLNDLNQKEILNQKIYLCISTSISLLIWVFIEINNYSHFKNRKNEN